MKNAFLKFLLGLNLVLGFSGPVWSEQLPPELEGLLKDFGYGYYQAEDEREKAALKALQHLVDGLVDPKQGLSFRVIISDTLSFSPRLLKSSWYTPLSTASDSVGEAIPEADYFIEVPLKLLRAIKTEDELAAALLRMMIQASGPYGANWEQRFETALDAEDQWILERLVELGYNPDGYNQVLLLLNKTGQLLQFFTFRGNEQKLEMRLTAIRHWLSENVRKVTFAASRPASDDLKALPRPKNRVAKNFVNPFKRRKERRDRISLNYLSLPKAFQQLMASTSYERWDVPTRFMVLIGLAQRVPFFEDLYRAIAASPKDVLRAPNFETLGHEFVESGALNSTKLALLSNNQLFTLARNPNLVLGADKSVVRLLIQVLASQPPSDPLLQQREKDGLQLATQYYEALLIRPWVSLKDRADFEHAVLKLKVPGLLHWSQADLDYMKSLNEVSSPFPKSWALDPSFLVDYPVGRAYMVAAANHILEQGPEPELMYRVLDFFFQEKEAYSLTWIFSQKALSEVRKQRKAILDLALAERNEWFARKSTSLLQPDALDSPIRPGMMKDFKAYALNKEEPVLVRLRTLSRARGKLVSYRVGRAEQKEFDAFSELIHGVIRDEMATTEPLLNPNYAFNDQPEFMASFTRARPSYQLSWDEFEQIITSDQPWKKEGVANELAELVKQVPYLDALQARNPQMAAAFEVVDRYKGPAYDYDIAHSLLLQQWLVKNLEESGSIDPLEATSASSLRKWRQLWHVLATRGATEFTDNLAAKIFSDEAWDVAPLTGEQAMAIFENRLLWDFSLRYQVWNKAKSTIMEAQRLKTSGARMLAVGGRDAFIEAMLTLMDRVYPEISLPRMLAFEDFANEIAANYHETLLIEAAKLSSARGLLTGATKMFEFITEHVYSQRRALKVLKFVMGQGPVPQYLAKPMQAIGESRFRRIVDQIPADLRALILIHPLLAPPRGLLGTVTGEAHAMDLILDNLPKYTNNARLGVEGILHAIQKVTPFEKSLVIAQFLSFKTTQATTPVGKILRYGLEDIAGSFGVSVGQKLLQRNLLADDIAAEMTDLHDKTRLPARVRMFEQIMQELNLTPANIDQTLSVRKIVGGGKARVVLEVAYHDEPNTSVAFKLGRPDLLRSTQVEVEQIQAFYDYVKSHDPTYRRMESVMEFIERSLVIGADNTGDLRAYPKISELYEGKKGERFTFHVVRPNEKRGINQQIAHEEFSAGQSLTSLRGQDRKDAFRDLLKVGLGILFKESQSPDDQIYFEGDRQKGNTMADLKRNVLDVVDYPMLFSIRAEERDSLMQAFGFLHSFMQGEPVPAPRWLPGFIKTRLSRKVLSQFFLAHFGKLLVDNQDKKQWARFEKKARAYLIKAVKKGDASEEPNLMNWFYDVVALAGESNLKLKSDVNNFLMALGNEETYADGDPEPVIQAIRENFLAHYQEPQQAKGFLDSLRWFFQTRKMVKKNIGLKYQPAPASTCEGVIQ